MIGVIFLLVGLFFTFINFGLGIICGWPLIVIGFILIIVGAAISDSSQIQTTYINQNIRNDRYCPNYGRSIPFDAMICPYCGRNFSK